MEPVAALGGGGVVGAAITGLIVVIGYLLKSNASDRKEYRAALDAAEERAVRAERRREAVEVAASQRYDELQQIIDESRTARRLVEDQLALVQRELARYQSGGGL